MNNKIELFYDLLRIRIIEETISKKYSEKEIRNMVKVDKEIYI